MLGEALNSGADDFISKPPVADELYARLRAAERLGAMQRELVRLASVDPLTGRHNGRLLSLPEGRAYGGVLTAIMLDIDHFKRVNDLYGHDVEALAAVARVQPPRTQSSAGLAARNSPCWCAADRSPRRRARVARWPRSSISANGPMTLTCSFGVSEAGEATASTTCSSARTGARQDEADENGGPACTTATWN